MIDAAFRDALEAINCVGHNEGKGIKVRFDEAKQRFHFSSGSRRVTTSVSTAGG